MEKLSKIIARTNKRKVKNLEGHVFERSISPNALRWIDANTSGRFNIGLNRIVFEDSCDAMMFGLKYTK